MKTLLVIVALVAGGYYAIHYFGGTVHVHAPLTR